MAIVFGCYPGSQWMRLFHFQDVPKMATTAELEEEIKNVKAEKKQIYDYLQKSVEKLYKLDALEQKEEDGTLDPKEKKRLEFLREARAGLEEEKKRLQDMGLLIAARLDRLEARQSAGVHQLGING
jgi:hypothetical protein